MWRAGVACALLAALAAQPPPPPSCRAGHRSACDRLRCEALTDTNASWPNESSVSVDGVAVNVTLYWGSGPARAAAALLGALLTHVHGYQRVRLARGPLSTAALADYVPFHSDAKYNDLAIGISTAWTPEAPRPWLPHDGRKSGVAGPRLSEFGRSPVPVRCRLFAWLRPHARALPLCSSVALDPSHANATALARCGFRRQNPRGNGSTFEVLIVDECNSKSLRALGPTFTMLDVNRTYVFHALHAAKSKNDSFLFIDFDIWEAEPGISVMDQLSCTSMHSDCGHNLDSTIALRVADVQILQIYAPDLFSIVYDFKPTITSIRYLLEREANEVNTEEASCERLLKYPISYKYEYTVTKYNIRVFICSVQQDTAVSYFNVLKNFTQHIARQMFENKWKFISILKMINCSDTKEMSLNLNNLTSIMSVHRMLGVISLAVGGAKPASSLAAAHRVPLLQAAVVPEDAAGADTTWCVAGRPHHVARALHHFVLHSGWTRVAVLSQQPTDLAQDYNDALRHNTTITFGHFQIPLHFTKPEAQEALRRLRAANARIVFVNADSEAAVVILAAAVELGMTYEAGYVWIVRDWRPNNVSCQTAHFVLSLWPRDERDIPPGEGNRSLKDNLRGLFRGSPWPPHTVSLANALITLTNGFTNALKQNPNLRYDLHSAQAMSSLHRNIIENPADGINQELHFKNRSIEETSVFADRWCGGQFRQRLARWRVNASSGAVRGNYTPPPDLPQDDGTSRCGLSTGDKFDPDCYDYACASVLLLLVLACAALLLARRVLRRRLARLQQEQQIQVIARRRHVAAVLAAYLVERDALELREELGAGRFGSVRLARLRTSAHNTRYVAAKALRDNAAPAEESEFLREACTIASLDHAHVVRLVGVCIADGPPLVLMELAFFGDLLRYLRARRHLVEGASTEAPAASGEAEHVSAEALTRLAREAAEALQYLGARGVVHRDVRAANCLVDVRRSLKLADFGMARDTVAGADGAPEYACRRRGLFPVLWMAPESLAHGVFSAASDVWAFGVLLLELVTLGARPYGTMSPLRVLEYVAGGGSAPLPLDASPQTRGLARLCWARAAGRRPSAAELAAYLAAWPRALRPALLSERDEPADADSGIGDSPSTELLPPDSPFHSLGHQRDFAATH